MAMSVGKRKRGRPKRRWSECNQEELESIGAVPTDAADRSKWRSLVCTSGSGPVGENKLGLGAMVTEIPLRHQPAISQWRANVEGQR